MNPGHTNCIGIVILDSIFLVQEALDQRLQLRRARECGICTIREELYAQAFGIKRSVNCISFRISAHYVLADELIREITIECAERGLLLLRIRDEARMRIAAYQTLYESSLAFAVRKAILADSEKLELEQKVCRIEEFLRESL